MHPMTYKRYLTLLIAFSSAAVWLPSSVPVSKANGSATIAIIPFENLSGRPEYNWIGESFSQELASLLDRPGLSAIQSEERDVAYKQEGLPPTAILTRATMIKIAERAGANLVVMGTYRVNGEGRESQITVTSRTVNISEGRLMGREFSEGGPLLELERLQGELAFEILYQHDPAQPFSRDQVVSQATATPIGAFENFVKGKLTREHDAKVGFIERAIKEYSEKTGGQYTAAVFELGRIRYEDRDYKEALNLFHKIDEKDPRFEEAVFCIGVAEDALSQTDKALASFDRLAPVLPLYEVYNNIGVLYLKKGQHQEAISHLKPASDAAPRDTDTLFNLGYAYYLAKDYAHAVETLRNEIERRPNDPEALYVLSKALAAAGDQTGAARAADQAKKQLASFAQWETKGMGFAGRMKTDFSKANYYRYKRDQQSKQSSGSAPAVEATQQDQLLESARTAFSAGRDEEALATLSRLLQSAPQSSEAHLLMGRIYERRGETDRATNSLKAALFWNPKLVGAHVLLGRISILKGDCQSAKASAEKARQIDPNDQDGQALSRLVEQQCKEKSS
jgi:tetratricopeptide (TPR) repeat protein